MKTKKVLLFMGLYPGWQDMQPIGISAFTPGCCGLGDLPDGWKRIKIEVELPMFGGSADAEQTVYAKSEEAKATFNPEGGQ